MTGTLKNIVTAVGLYWLSFLLAVPLSMLVDKINRHITYDESALEAILMGVVLSLGLAIAAGAAGVCLVLIAEGRHPEIWAIIPAALYAARPLHSHFVTGPTNWDRLWIGAERYFPAVACLGAALLFARARRARTAQSPTSAG
jgi:hypothetical protein